MERIQEVVKVFDRFVKVSTVPAINETMVFYCDEDGKAFDTGSPILEKHYTSKNEIQDGHNNLVEMYRDINNNGYTRADWKGSFYDNLKINQYVHDEVVEELANCLPPRTYTRYKIQLGERYNSNGYATFRKENGFWYYVGLEN